jgi:hypothetical protein
MDCRPLLAEAGAETKDSEKATAKANSFWRVSCMVWLGDNEFL